LQALEFKNENAIEKFKNTKSSIPNAVVAYVTMKSMEGRE